MTLRRSDPNRPGLRRVRRGRGFSYQDESGAAITDPATLRRIHDLTIPPAWREVWISPHPDGHIQAVGRDAAGRRQYLYHAQWQEERSEEKFDRTLEMSAQLPAMRRQLLADLRGRGLSRDRVLALALHLLDLGYFRAGGEQYAEENESFGIATLRCEHVSLQRSAVEFDYPAKSGVRRTWSVADPDVMRAVRALLRRPDRGDRFLVCRITDRWVEVQADDLNERFRELVGADYTVKDLRTWHGTVLAAVAFADADPPVDPKVVKRVESAVFNEVAEALGNTPAVARSSYVDPRVVQAYEHGVTIAATTRRAERTRDPRERREILEAGTARMLRKVTRGL